MLELINKANCCGCTACKSICPKNAIKMQEDGEKYKGGQPARCRHASYPYHRADGWLAEGRGRCGYREDPRMYLILRRVQRSHKYG